MIRVAKKSKISAAVAKNLPDKVANLQKFPPKYLPAKISQVNIFTIQSQFERIIP